MNRGFADKTYAIIWLPSNRCSECEANSALVIVVSFPFTIMYLSFGRRIFAAVIGVSLLFASSWSISPCTFAKRADEVWYKVALSSSDMVGVGSRKANVTCSFCD